MAPCQIYELSARAVMSYAAEQDGVYTFALNRSATEHCKLPSAKHEQDSCAMFHQLMYQLHGEGWREHGEEKVTALSDVLFYMDFAGIFDRRGTGRMQQARRDLEALAIYSGLEIDAAKTSVRPNLDEFLHRKSVKRTPFLQYKYLLERAEERRRAWYEPTHRERLEAFFAGIDWEQVDSPVERLPWLTRQLERNTPRVQEKPAKDSELFAFAQERSWKKRLDENILSSVSALLWDYEHCLSRIRACRAPAKGQQRKTDIDRILYARGQEEVCDSDEMYAFFQQVSPERITALRKAIVERQWHLMTEEQREDFLREHLPEGADYYDLLTDFRHGGFRMLGDLVCDIDDLAAARERKQLRRPVDSPAFQKMMEAYLSAPFSGNERAVVSRVCRKLLNRSSGPVWRCPMWWPWASGTCCGTCCRITSRNMFWR